MPERLHAVDSIQKGCEGRRGDVNPIPEKTFRYDLDQPEIDCAHVATDATTKEGVGRRRPRRGPFTPDLGADQATSKRVTPKMNGPKATQG